MKRQNVKQLNPGQLAAKKKRREKRKQETLNKALSITREHAFTVRQALRQVEFSNQFNDEVIAKLEILEEFIGKDKARELYKKPTLEGEENEQVQSTVSIEEDTGSTQERDPGSSDPSAIGGRQE